MTTAIGNIHHVQKVEKIPNRVGGHATRVIYWLNAKIKSAQHAGSDAAPQSASGRRA